MADRVGFELLIRIKEQLLVKADSGGVTPRWETRPGREAIYRRLRSGLATSAVVPDFLGALAGGSSRFAQFWQSNATRRSRCEPADRRRRKIADVLWPSEKGDDLDGDASGHDALLRLFLCKRNCFRAARAIPRDTLRCWGRAAKNFPRLNPRLNGNFSLGWMGAAGEVYVYQTVRWRARRDSNS
jgi:hypothetical protein